MQGLDMKLQLSVDNSCFQTSLCNEASGFNVLNWEKAAATSTAFVLRTEKPSSPLAMLHSGQCCPPDTSPSIPVSSTIVWKHFSEVPSVSGESCGGHVCIRKPPCGGQEAIGGKVCGQKLMTYFHSWFQNWPTVILQQSLDHLRSYLPSGVSFPLNHFPNILWEQNMNLNHIYWILYVPRNKYELLNITMIS